MLSVQDLVRVGRKVLLYLPPGGSCTSLTDCGERCGPASPTRHHCTRPSADTLDLQGGIWAPSPDNPFRHSSKYHWLVNKDV